MYRFAKFAKQKLSNCEKLHPTADTYPLNKRTKYFVLTRVLLFKAKSKHGLFECVSARIVAVTRKRNGHVSHQHLHGRIWQFWRKSKKG